MDSNTTIKVVGSPCTKLDLRVSITSFANDNFALSVSITLSIVLTDVVLKNNKSPLMNIAVTNFVTFSGNFIISSNNAYKNGRIIKQEHIVIHAGSRINITNNHFSNNILSLMDDASLIIGNASKDAVVINFQNNTIKEGGIFAIINSYAMGRIINAEILFINNTSISFNDVQDYAGAMLLRNSDVLMENSNLKFVANSSPLGGGLILTIES